MTYFALQVKELTKRYSDSYSLGPITFELNKGETIAILGKNGAGKTTMFQLLTGNLDATNGTIHVGEARMLPEKFELKLQIGYLPQNLLMPRWSTGRELLNYVASLYQLDGSKQKIDNSMRYWDCEEFQGRPIAALSHGMQKRIALAIATIHDPACLILDEPFSGLDLFHIRALDLEIQRRQRSGKSTIMSTHVSHYAAKLCQRAFILEQGSMRPLDDWMDSDLLARVDRIEHEFFPAEGKR